jgi:hypothetical protein
MERKDHIKNPTSLIETTIKDFINKSPENTLKNSEDEKAWEEPLVGFSSGDDPLYQEYKEYVGPFHWTPPEIFGNTFPELQIQAEDLTVISWVLPQTEATKSDNQKETTYPSERWARARMFGEQVNVKLTKHVVATLQQAGFRAVAPSLLSPSFKWVGSERHAAYASGLGTFGLCDGLITPRARRCVVGQLLPKSKFPLQNGPTTVGMTTACLIQKESVEMYPTSPGRSFNPRRT